VGVNVYLHGIAAFLPRRGYAPEQCGHQRFLLSIQIRHIDEIDIAIAAVGDEIEARLRPFEEAARRLMTVPGVGQRKAQTGLSEVGTDMSRFPTGIHLASWAAVCPGDHESAGKQRRGRTRKGSPWLRSVLLDRDGPLHLQQR